MSKKTKKRTQKKKVSGASGRMKLLIGISISAVLLIALSVTLVILLLGGGKTVMQVNRKGISEELYSYWLSYGKYTYLARNAAEDTPAFWASDNGEGMTHEQACRRDAEAYMVQMLVSAELYEAIGGKLTEGEREMLSARAEAVLQYDVSSRSAYDKIAKQYGFSYSAMCEAMIYAYKSEVLQTVMTGDEGSSLNDDQIEYYFEQFYTRALILEIRTKDYFKIDDEGDYVQNSDGTYKLFQMTDEEKAAAQDKIDRICQTLTNDGSLESFEALYEVENEDVRRALYSDGYFFSENSEFASYFADNLPTDADDVLKGIFAQEINTWRRYNAGDRCWIIFVTGTTERPYEDSANEDFFHDLSSDAADYYYVKTLSEEIEAAQVSYERETTDKTSVSDLGYDYRLYFY